jgi:DNA repair protein RadC
MEQVSQTVSEISVVYRNKLKASERPVISTSTDAHKILLTAFNQDTIAYQEQFVAAYLNRANQVLGLYRVGVGGITGVVADPRMVLAVALKIAAVSIVVGHNHPSGNLRPSKADEDLTYKLKEGGKLLDVKLLDHLIVAPDGESYFSFADDGAL